MVRRCAVGTGGRAAEGTGLLNRRVSIRGSAGSNPALSASPRNGRFRPYRGVFCGAPGSLVGEGFAFTSALLALVATQALIHQTVPPTFAGAVPLADAGILRLAARPEAADLAHVLVVSTSQPGGAVAIVLSAP